MAKDASLATEPSAEGDTLKEARFSPTYWWDAVSEQVDNYDDWNETVDNIMKQVYSAERLGHSDREREMQISWANSEVLKPAIYTSSPIPAVISRHKDRKPLVQHGAEILERCLGSSFDSEDIHETLLLVRDDVIDCSRGVLWVRLDKNEVGQKVIQYDHVDRKDFYHSPDRYWKEVWWVSRRIYLNEAECEDQFGKEITEKLSFQKIEKTEGIQAEGDPQTEIFEVWDKVGGHVMWISENCDQYLDVMEPPIRVKGFFPCPKPAFGTRENRSLRPIPHWLFIKDQIEEINEMTARISALSENLRLKGFYAQGHEDVSEALERILEDEDNRATLVPVPSTHLMSGQSLADVIVWLPIRETSEVIGALINVRKQLINDVYEITGISDIMRGQSAASETATAQQLKSEYGSVRVRRMQGEMIRIAKDAANIAGEILAENFDQPMLQLMSQYDKIRTEEQRGVEIEALKTKVEKAKTNPQVMQQMQQNPQMAQQLVAMAQAEIDKLMQEVTFDQVMTMLREQRVRPFLIDIETDSTVMANEDQNKQRSAEFLTALGGALAQLGQMVDARPETAPFAGEVLKFAVSPYRAGRELDAAIDEMIDMMKKPKPPQQDPAAAKAEADAAAKKEELQAKLQSEQAKAQMDQQAAQARMQSDQQAAQARAQADAQIAKAKIDAEREIAQMKLDAERAMQAEKMEMEAEIAKMKYEIDMANLDLERQKIDMQARQITQMARGSNGTGTGDRA